MMIDAAAAFLVALGTAPGLLLAIAAAPLLLRGRLAAALVTVDLALVLEIQAALVEPGYAFGSAFLPRLLASAAHVGLAAWALRTWRRYRRAGEAVAG